MTRSLLAGVVFVLAATSASAALDAQPAPSLGVERKVVELAGKLPAAPWATYKARFITVKGRVVDTANNSISHSEGQGYALLLAVAAGDRETFDRIWGWTRANLMVRDDQLVAWRWEPTARPAVADTNNATDGNLLIAWALAEAAEVWNDMAYRMAARRLAVEIGRKLILNRTRFGPMLLPAVAGFSAEDRRDGPVVNLSYWVFPAFARLTQVAPEIDWAGLGQSGLDLIRLARFGKLELPSDWVSIRGSEPRPAEGLPQTFAYNSIRIPLYLVWAGVGEREHLRPFASLWQSGAPTVVETATGERLQVMDEPGYAAVAALTECAVSGRAIPSRLRTPAPGGNYYPATLHLLALVAAQAKEPSCLREH